MIVLLAASFGLIQMAGSSAASPPCGTGSVSTVAVTVSSAPAIAAADGPVGLFALEFFEEELDSVFLVASATFSSFALFLSLLAWSLSPSSDFDFSFFLSFF